MQRWKTLTLSIMAAYSAYRWKCVSCYSNIYDSIRATVTTNVDCPMKIGQKCFCAVHDKHLFHVSFNEALLIGAANSSVSENNPETSDSVRKSIKNRPFLRISENFEKKTKKPTKPKQNKPKKKKIWQLVYLQKYLARSLFFLVFCFFFVLLFLFFFVFCFLFWFCWLLGLQSFVLCRKLVLNH